MESSKWEVLQSRFIKTHESTGISVKNWCEKNNLNYNTARRYIKVEEKNTTLIIQNPKQLSQATKRKVASFGNQNARTLGHYSEFIATDEDALRHNSALRASLSEELALLRMQLSNLLVGIKKIEVKLEGELTVEQSLSLYDKYVKLQTSFDIKIARIESLENSLIHHKKITADIEKTIILTEKTKLETDKMRNESSGANTELAEIYEKILNHGSDGMLNTKK